MGQAIKRGVVLMNLGSPESTSVADVKTYLKEFLMDERVIDSPYWWRSILVKSIIVPPRAPKSAEAYRTIWTPQGSPLIVITRQLQEALQAVVEEKVVIAMRYGNPSPAAAFNKLLKMEPSLEEVILVPLYPHYAMSSYETAVVYAREAHKKGNYPFRLATIKAFYDDPGYLDAMADNMKPWLNRDYDHILFSYHGIPERHIRKSDITGNHCLKSAACCDTASPAHSHCYRHQAFVTTRLIAQRLGLPADKYSISFQSRLGKGWLQPFTDVRFEQMPGEGIKKLLVLCPAFVSDCLETLEEIEERGKEAFMKAGGESFAMIPCLNVHPGWVNTIAGWVKDYAAGSLEMISD